ncbi:hypothetical protein MMC27_008913 [Xylographa pallens]|nr:hypothetical protein [Xylographa pallens]
MSNSGTTTGRDQNSSSARRVKRVHTQQDFAVARPCQVSTKDSSSITHKTLIDVARQLGNIEKEIVNIVSDVSADNEYANIKDVKRQFDELRDGSGSYHKDYLVDTQLLKYWNRAISLASIDFRPDEHPLLRYVERIGKTASGMNPIGLFNAARAGTLDADMQIAIGNKWLLLERLLHAFETSQSGPVADVKRWSEIASGIQGIESLRPPIKSTITQNDADVRISWLIWGLYALVVLSSIPTFAIAWQYSLHQSDLRSFRGGTAVVAKTWWLEGLVAGTDGTRHDNDLARPSALRYSPDRMELVLYAVCVSSPGVHGSAACLLWRMNDLGTRGGRHVSILQPSSVNELDTSERPQAQDVEHLAPSDLPTIRDSSRPPTFSRQCLHLEDVLAIPSRVLLSFSVGRTDVVDRDLVLPLAVGVTDSGHGKAGGAGVDRLA